MPHILYGDRIGGQGRLAIGCSAFILDETQKVLLVKRADNGRWAIPVDYFNLDGIKELNMEPFDRRRIAGSLNPQDNVIIRDNYHI